MADWRATSARSETRVTCERDKQDVRDRRDTKFEVLGSKFRKPRTSDLEPSSVSPVALFPPVSLVSLESGTGDCSRNVYE
jgi:hypothetical protein